MLRKQEVYLKAERQKQQDGLQQHKKQLADMSKRIAAGTYPSPEKAALASKVGLGLGYVLAGLGLIWAFYQPLRGVGTSLIGGITLLSNYHQLQKSESYLKKD